MPKLGWYLDKIARCEPVSLAGLRKAWAKEPRSGMIQDVLDLNVPAGTPIRVIHRDNFNLVCSLYGAGADLSTRASAAKTGQSHRVAVSSSLIPLRSLKHPHPENVVVHSDARIDTPRALACRALIVENLELFLSLDRLTAFCRGFTDIAPAAVDNAEILFGAGMGITKSLNAPFLRRFDEIYCLPDLDVGGLKIVESLISQVGAGGVICLAPNDLPRWLSLYGRAITQTEHDELLAIANRCPSLRLIAQALMHAGKKLEQEVYLEHNT